MQPWSVNFLCCAGNVGFDVQLNIIFTKAVDEALFEDVRAVQSGLVGCGNIVVDTDWEGNAGGGQFLDGLLLILLCFVRVQSGQGLTVFLNAQFFLYQVSIVGTVGGVDQTLHGVGVVFTAHRVDGVQSGVVLLEVEPVVPGEAEGLVGNCQIPVVVRGAVFVVLCKVEVNLPGIFGRQFFNQIVMELVVFIIIDGGQVALGQCNIIQFPCLIQLESDIGRLYHLDGDCVKKGALGVPIFRVFGLYLFVALNVGGHEVWSVVPHGLVVHRAHAVRAAQLIDHCLRDWEQAGVGCYRVKIWFRVDAMVNDGVIIRNLNAYHLQEGGTFARSQRVSFFLAQCLGVLVVLVSALNHFQRH